MTAHNEPQISRRLTQIVLSGLQEYIGRAGLEKLAQHSGVAIPEGTDQLTGATGGLLFNEISVMQQALEEVYGPQAARGVAMRSGRAALCYFLSELGEEGGFHQLEFRVLPPRKRAQAGLERIATLVGREAGQPIQIQSLEKAWLWQIELCPECWERKNPTSMCYFSVGLLQEFLSWLSGGRIYLVEETACRAKGDPACVIRIDKKPLD